MKTHLLKQRFEIIFSLSLIAILALPPLVLAQDTKSIEIKIVNGDTTINGKDIKKLSPQERKDALDEIDKTGNITFKHTDKDGKRDIVIRRNRITRGNKNNDVTIERHMFGNEDNNSSPYAMEFGPADSVRKTFKLRLRKLRGADTTFAFNFKNDQPFELQFDDERPMRIEDPRRFNGPARGRFMEFNHRNSQTFNYSNTDNDGISTNVSFRITDAPREVLKRMAGVEKAELDLNDLNLVPEFSTGRTTLTFNLPAKTAATAKMTDSEGKLLWSDKVTAGSFNKKVNMPRNGIYFLTVKQGANTAVKRIVKED